jgi:hypothetical protein
VTLSLLLSEKHPPLAFEFQQSLLPHLLIAFPSSSFIIVSFVVIAPFSYSCLSCDFCHHHSRRFHLLPKMQPSFTFIRLPFQQLCVPTLQHHPQSVYHEPRHCIDLAFSSYLLLSNCQLHWVKEFP